MSAGRKALDLPDLQSLYWSSEKAERDLLPLTLFRGAVSLGGVQALWNLTQALRASEVATTGEATRFIGENPDVVHASGFHPSRDDLRHFGDKLNRLADRVHASPAVQKAAPGVYEYLREMMYDSRRRLYPITPISRYNPYSSQAWRRPPQVVKPKRLIGPDEPTNPSWPFLRESTPVEHIEGADLLVAVDLLIPKQLPKQVRDDVCQDVVLAILEGEITLAELNDRYQDYIKGVFRKFPIKYGHLSLDRPPPWDSSGRTLAESLEAA